MTSNNGATYWTSDGTVPADKLEYSAEGLYVELWAIATVVNTHRTKLRGYVENDGESKLHFKSLTFNIIKAIRLIPTHAQVPLGPITVKT